MPILFEFADEHYNREHPFPAMTRVIFCINAVDPRFSAWTLTTTHNSKTHIFTVSLPFPYCDDTSFSFLIGSIQSLKSFLSFFFFFFSSISLFSPLQTHGYMAYDIYLQHAQYNRSSSHGWVSAWDRGAQRYILVFTLYNPWWLIIIPSSSISILSLLYLHYTWKPF